MAATPLAPDESAHEGIAEAVARGAADAAAARAGAGALAAAAAAEQLARAAGAVRVRPWAEGDLGEMLGLWNGVVEAANAFPQVEPLGTEDGRAFFASQSLTAVAELGGRVVGLYILHPNNVGRCSHVANASYAVAPGLRGHGIGRALVTDSLRQLAPLGFRGLQFNAVVASNEGAIALYESLGFTRVGTVPGGFRNGEGSFEDIHVFYHPAP